VKVDYACGSEITTALKRGRSVTFNASYRNIDRFFFYKFNLICDLKNENKDELFQSNYFKLLLNVIILFLNKISQKPERNISSLIFIIKKQT